MQCKVHIQSNQTTSLESVFEHFLLVTMVNVQNAGVYFCNLHKVDSLTARKRIAQQLIENKYLIAERVQQKQP